MPQREPKSLWHDARRAVVVAYVMLLTTAGTSVAALIGAALSNAWLLIPGVLFGAMFVCALVVTEDIVR